MSNEFNLIAELREQGEGTSSSRRLRRSGLVPGVIYGAGKDTIKLSIDHNQLLRKLSIDNFLSKHKGKKVIVVQGLGFVGAVMTLVCANALTEEYAVIGVDLADKNNYWKINRKI